MHLPTRAAALVLLASLTLIVRHTRETGAAPADPPKKSERFSVPQGFRVESVVAAGAKIDGYQNADLKVSFVNMCFDGKGRLFLSQERGPTLLCTNANNEGLFTHLVPFCEQIKNSHGMCWVSDVLYLVGDGPAGPGLYRCRDTKKSDKIDQVELLLKSRQQMGEHGPHAVVHGPDGKLYVAFGNHGSPIVQNLAANSPLTRWPTGAPGPDQGNVNTREDVLLPRQNDPHGFSPNTLAPGGTVWRLDLDGKNPALVAAGFRNHFDIAFGPSGELFTFDSDMEGDEGLPWYRAVKVCHCIPGADFLWRIGSANTPSYYVDSLPPVLETGRGSPTGVEFYGHDAFPTKYRGAMFMCDWSIGVLWVVHLKRDGASYKGEAEKFCIGTPMPFTDCAVGPDGALYFAAGGRSAQGEVFRIVYDRPASEKAEPSREIQPLAPWSKPRRANAGPEQLLAEGGDPGEKRAREVMLLGIKGSPDADDLLVKALADEDALVRRRACEAYVRLGIQPPLAHLVPLLGDKDRFVRAGARLALQRIDAAKWADGLLRHPDDRVAREAIITLCKIDRAAPYAEKMFQRLHDKLPESQEELLEWLRVVQLALIHTTDRPGAIRGIALDCLERFPEKDKFVNRELAILLAEFARTKVLTEGVAGKLAGALKEAKDDRQQQIHYAYCLRLVKDGWNAADKQELLAWFESTRTWTGGDSYKGYLQNILRDASDIWSLEEQQALIGRIAEMPMTATAMLLALKPEQLPAPEQLLAMFKQVKPNQPSGFEIKSLIVDAIGRSRAASAPAALRSVAVADSNLRLVVARFLARHPEAENLPFILQGLTHAQAPVAEFLDALKKNAGKPKPDDAKALRIVLESSRKLQGFQKWKAVEVLRHWTSGKSFGAEKDKEWKSELAAWSLWYVQTFPKEPGLPDVASDRPIESKYKYADLRAYLEKDSRGSRGDAAKGRAVFEKAHCIKCHKHGSAGEGIGPDLSAVSQRFKRFEILESIMDPSKVISDQYRSSQISTLDGRTFIGLAVEMGDNITILLNDGSKSTIKKSDVESKIASLVSVMPEKLLDELTVEEIADLFAFLESGTMGKR